jgi:uncharacterized membrane protein HdeD (DUF308 family)
MSADVWEDVFKGAGTALIIRGALAVLFAALVILWPDATVLAPVLLFGIFALTDGAVAVGDWFRRRRQRSMWALAGGLASVGAGVVSLFWPGPRPWPWHWSSGSGRSCLAPPRPG